MREVVRHPGAVVILPVTDDKHVYLVRQYRKPVEKELLELPAGTLENTEKPLECAKRELSEELNLEASNWFLLTSVYTSPGFNDEKMYFFVAQGLKKCQGKTDDDEYIEVEKMRLDSLYEKIQKNVIEDGKTVLALSLYKNININ